MAELSQQQYVRMDGREIVEGPKLLPYRWSHPATGDIEALRTKTQQELKALGWEPLRVVDVDEAPDETIGEMRIEPVKISDGKPTVVRRLVFTEKSRDRMKERVDQEAGRKRMSYISGGSGQEIEYAEKLWEARDLLRRFGRDMTDEEFREVQDEYPYIKEDIGVTQPTARDVVLDIHSTAMTWAMIGAKIARERRIAKKNIDEAPDNRIAYRMLRRYLDAGHSDRARI